MWKFINFQLRRWREHAQAQTLKKKQVPSKSKSKKDKGEQGAQSNYMIVSVFFCKALDISPSNKMHIQAHTVVMKLTNQMGSKKEATLSLLSLRAHIC